MSKQNQIIRKLDWVVMRNTRNCFFLTPCVYARLPTCFVWTVLDTNLALGLTGNNSLRSYQHFLLHRLSQWESISWTHLTMIIAENLNFQQQELSLNHWWIVLEGIGVQKLKLFSCVPNWIVLVFIYINISDFFCLNLSFSF